MAENKEGEKNTEVNKVGGINATIPMNQIKISKFSILLLTKAEVSY